MVDNGHLAVRLFDLKLSGLRRDAEGVVVGRVDDHFECVSLICECSAVKCVQIRKKFKRPGCAMGGVRWLFRGSLSRH